MDLRNYYKKINEAASVIPDEFALVMSKESPDGGKEGVFCEVTRLQAAKLLVEERARLADAKEAKKFYEEQGARESSNAPVREQPVEKKRE